MNAVRYRETALHYRGRIHTKNFKNSDELLEILQEIESDRRAYSIMEIQINGQVLCWEDVEEITNGNCKLIIPAF